MGRYNSRRYRFFTAASSTAFTFLIMLSTVAPAALAEDSPADSMKSRFGSRFLSQALTGDNPEKLPPVLPPGQFFGAAAMGYAAAKAVPQVCYKVFCYCGCDITDRHKNLLDCFVTTHGADCHICQEEALMALKMNRSEKPLSAVQKSIDQTYSNKYPFNKESPALKTYKQVRLWTKGKTKSEVAKTESKAGKSKAEACCNGEKK